MKPRLSEETSLLPLLCTNNAASNIPAFPASRTRFRLSAGSGLSGPMKDRRSLDPAIICSAISSDLAGVRVRIKSSIFPVQFGIISWMIVLAMRTSSSESAICAPGAQSRILSTSLFIEEVMALSFNSERHGAPIRPKNPSESTTEFFVCTAAKEPPHRPATFASVGARLGRVSPGAHHNPWPSFRARSFCRRNAFG